MYISLAYGNNLINKVNGGTMDSFGIVRRIDNLGRIVIPMEIRRNLKLKEGDPLELNVLDANIIVKKFSAVNNIGDDLVCLCDEISSVLKISVLITDLDKILTCSGENFDLYLSKNIEKDLKKIISKRKIVHSSSKDSHIPIFLQDNFHYKEQIIIPIVSNGEAQGSLIGISDKNIDKLKEEVLEIFSKILSKKIE
ncbi:MAG: stage V sporulation T C-terminal domain-containing protein [Lachnospirales bacterium]